jgi:hypothetical protein
MIQSNQHQDNRTSTKHVFLPETEDSEAVLSANEVWEVNFPMLRKCLLGMPTQAESLLRLLDGRRSLADVVKCSDLPNELTMRVLYRLKRQGVVVPSTKIDQAMPSAADSVWYKLTEAPTLKPSAEGNRLEQEVATSVDVEVQAPENDTLIEDTLSIIDSELAENMEPDALSDISAASSRHSMPGMSFEKTTIPVKPSSKEVYGKYASQEREQNAGRGLTALPELQIRDPEPAHNDLESVLPEPSEISFLASLEEGPGSFCFGSEVEGLAESAIRLETSPTLLARRTPHPPADGREASSNADRDIERDAAWSSVDVQKSEAADQQRQFELGELEQWAEDDGPKMLSLGPTARRILKREGQGLLRDPLRAHDLQPAGRHLCHKEPREPRSEEVHSPRNRTPEEEPEPSAMGQLAMYFVVGGAGGYGLIQFIATMF